MNGGVVGGLNFRVLDFLIPGLHIARYDVGHIVVLLYDVLSKKIVKYASWMSGCICIKEAGAVL